MKISTKRKNVKVTDKEGHDVIVDGKQIYLDLSSGNVMEFTRLAEKTNEDDATALYELSKAVFEEKSFDLVRMLMLDDFIMVMDLVAGIIDQYKNETEQRFTR